MIIKHQLFGVVLEVLKVKKKKIYIPKKKDGKTYNIYPPTKKIIFTHDSLWMLLSNLSGTWRSASYDLPPTIKIYCYRIC